MTDLDDALRSRRTAPRRHNVMIEIHINEVRESEVNGVVSVTTPIVSGTFPSKLAAAALRALADEWDPKLPVYRGDINVITRGGTT